MTGVWIAFLGFVLFLLFLDLGVFHRKARAVNVREALAWSGVWSALGLSFAVFVYYGYEKGIFFFRISRPGGGNAPFRPSSSRT